jgi:hypothetical protein
MFSFNYYSKIYPEKDVIHKTIPIIQFGFLFIERKRRMRNLKILKMRSETIELDSLDLNII